MTSVGPGHYVVVVLHVRGSKASDIKLVLNREPRSGKTWFPAGSITPNEAYVDSAVRELHAETGLILTPDDLTVLSDAPVCVAIHEGHQLVYVYSDFVPVPNVTTHVRIPAQLEQVVTAQSTINPDGSYVVPWTIDIDSFTLTPTKKGLLPALKPKFDLLNFGYVTQRETFRRGVYTHQVLYHDDTSIPRQFLMYPRFTSLDCGHVWMLIRGYINKLCGQTPTDLRIGALVTTSNFTGLPVTHTETQRKAAINSKFQSGRDPRELEDRFKAQPQRIVLLGITADSYDAVIWLLHSCLDP
jgi:ADP-ribose pyrophosphatase YjhB (NUDIX family)